MKKNRFFSFLMIWPIHSCLTFSYKTNRCYIVMSLCFKSFFQSKMYHCYERCFAFKNYFLKKQILSSFQLIYVPYTHYTLYTNYLFSFVSDSHFYYSATLYFLAICTFTTYNFIYDYFKFINLWEWSKSNTNSQNYITLMQIMVVVLWKYIRLCATTITSTAI